MRSFLGLAVSLLVVWGGCSKIEVHACTADGDCGGDSVCVRGYCVFDPLPRLRVEASGDRARVGEEVRLDASRSFVPDGGSIELELRLHPEGAAEVVPSGEAMVHAFRILEPHQNVEAVLVGRTVSGRETSWSGVVAPLNSAPRLELLLPERLQAGERLRIGLLVEDPDGDPVEVDWSYEGEGAFVAKGLEAELRIPEGADEGWHRIEVRGDDGIDAAKTSVTFQPKNEPPRILEIRGAKTVAHSCNEAHCSAQAAFEVVADDAGVLRYHWRLVDEWDGEVTILGENDAKPVFVLKGPIGKPIAGTYRLEVEVRDSHDALATASTEFTVGNRPPSLDLPDPGVIHHTVLSEGRYRWLRPAESVEIWEDPDGDPPIEVKWSSPDARVRFADPHRLDTSIWIDGDEGLLDARIPLVVEAREANGGEARAEAHMSLGNRPPEFEFLEYGTPYLSGLGEEFYYETVVTIGFSDPDGDPVELTVDFDPRFKPPLGFWLHPTPEGVKIRGPWTQYFLRIQTTARDPFGGLHRQTHGIDLR